MPIFFFAEDVSDVWKNKRLTSGWLKTVAKAENSAISELNLILMSDDGLLNMNRQFLHHDYYTDVITFDLRDEIQGAIKGEVYISYDRVKENAAKAGIAINLELCRVMVHGLLHLLGYNDKTNKDKLVIRAKEDFYLTLLADFKVSRGT